MNRRLKLLYKEYTKVEYGNDVKETIALTIWKADDFILIEDEDDKIYRYDKIRIGKIEDKEQYKQYIDEKYHNLPFYKVLDDNIPKVNENDELTIKPILDGEEKIVKELRLYEEVDVSDYKSITELYNEVKEYISEYIDFVDEQDLDKVTAFVFHCYFFKEFPTTLYLHLTGPKGSGKSKLADVLMQLLPRAIKSSSMSTAVAVYYIENYDAILILDEQDTIKNGSSDSVKNDYLNILNAGYRKGDSYQRIGEDGKPRSYDVFGPKVIVGRFNLPETLESRCLQIKMVRSSKPMPYLIDEERAEKLRAKLRQYAIDYADKIIIKDLPLADGRVRNLFVPLIACIPNEIVKSKFKDIIKNELEDRRELEQSNENAQIVNVLLDLNVNEISPSDLVYKLYKDLDDDKVRKKAYSIGRKLTKFGFKKVKKSDKNYYYCDSKVLERLKNTYGLYEITDFNLDDCGIYGICGTSDWGMDDKLSSENTINDNKLSSVDDRVDTKDKTPQTPQTPQSKSVVVIDKRNNKTLVTLSREDNKVKCLHCNTFYDNMVELSKHIKDFSKVDAIN